MLKMFLCAKLVIRVALVALLSTGAFLSTGFTSRLTVAAQTREQSQPQQSKENQEAKLIRLREDVISTISHRLSIPLSQKDSLESPQSLGVKLKAVRVAENNLMLDFSQEVKNYSGDQIADLASVIFDSLQQLLGLELFNDHSGESQGGAVVLLSEGESFDSIISRKWEEEGKFSQQTALQAKTVASLALASDLTYQTLGGKKIVLNPGHGFYYKESFSAWVLQRPWYSGANYRDAIVEDFTTHDIASYLDIVLKWKGADTRSVRELDRNSGTGESGNPRWQECAATNLKRLGFPSSVWNSGTSNYYRDINARPYYSNYIGADLMLSVHTNGSTVQNPFPSGTETYFKGDRANDARLGHLIHSGVVGKIRAVYNTNWKDRGEKSSSSLYNNYGEVALVNAPNALVEVGFHSTPSPDNDALHENSVKFYVASAMAEAAEAYYWAAADLRAINELKSLADYVGSFNLVYQGSFRKPTSQYQGYDQRCTDYRWGRTGQRITACHLTYQSNPNSSRWMFFYNPDSNQTVWYYIQ